MTYHVGILASHPIQYLSPFYRALASYVDLTVYYAHRQTASDQAEAGFDVAFEWDVELFDGYKYEFLENVAGSPGVEHFSGCDTPGIKEQVIGGKFDLFIVTGWYLKAFWQAVNACKKNGVPVVVRGDSQLETPRSGFKKILKAVGYRFLLRRFDGFLSVGQRNREYLCNYGVSEDRIFFSPHFVDNELFSSRKDHSVAAQTLLSLGAQPDSLTVLFVGKFTENKRPLDIVESVAALRDRRPELKVQCLFVGAGKLERDIRELATVKNVSVIFAGFRNQTELPAIYRAADLLVLPSKSETWGLVVNESMACGTPVIVSSAVGCAPDLIVPGATGDIYPVGDKVALATVIERSLQMKAQPFTSAALKSKSKVYSVGSAVNGVIAAIDSLYIDR